MGKKIRAAKASLVAAFLAAGGAAAAKALPPDQASAAPAGGASSIAWGDPLVRFLKLDGFPDYLKLDGFAAFVKPNEPYLLADAATLYEKWDPTVSDLLALYQKADGGPLQGVLVGLETYYKEKNIEPLLDYLKTPGAMDAYLKFEAFFSALRSVGGENENSAFNFFYKETGIAGDPLAQNPD